MSCKNHSDAMDLTMRVFRLLALIFRMNIHLFLIFFECRIILGLISQFSHLNKKYHKI